MGRVCVVPGCETGHYKDRNQRRALGLRQRAIFRAPKCSKRLSEWELALNCNLDVKTLVCELHFEETHIKKHNKTVLSHGEVHTMPLSVWHLTDNAIPISRSQDYTKVGRGNEAGEGKVEASDLDREPHHGHSTRSDIVSPALPMTLAAEENMASKSEMGSAVFTMDMLQNELNATLFPESWAWTHQSSKTIFTRLDSSSLCPTLHLEIAPDLSLQIRTNMGILIPLNEKPESMADVWTCLGVLEKMSICSGTGFDSEKCHRSCEAIFTADTIYKRKQRTPRCIFCTQLRHGIQRRIRRNRRSDRQKRHQAILMAKLTRRKFQRQQQKAKKLLINVSNLKAACAAVEKEKFEEKISSLPESQRQAVRTCVEAAKVEKSANRRYSLQWIYECLLMRIKNSRLYDHIRDRQILPLPCRATLQRYIQRISSSAYGFQSAIFECLKTKNSGMKVTEKRGTLLIDEMKLSEAISFNPQSLQVCGFIDLGQYTPEAKKNTRADYALVFMFQPFCGPWVQVLGAFLTKDSVTSSILHKLILECVILLTNSGYHIDVVTMDGAQWNRGVWRIFGIGDGQFHCEHPCDSTKKMWMVLDFPHLVKCFRNAFIMWDSFQTPDGIVKNGHWEALLQHERYTKPNLTIAYNLTPAHLNPAGYEKMNVRLAFQLFSLPVRVAMELYYNECPELSDSKPTQIFTEKMDKLIAAMMSRTPVNALHPSDDCPQKKAIMEFDKWLRQWESTVSGKDMPISTSTLTGFKVTLGATLELIEALRIESNYEFLMTARLNQDALERFFGMMRGACGSNDHPDPQLFAQVFRLLCSYSLIKPAKGSNVSGTELLQVLMQTEDSLAMSKKPRSEWLNRIDRLLEDSDTGDCDRKSHEQDHNYEASATMTCSEWNESVHDHTYDVARTSPQVQAYIAGYVVRRMRRRLKCDDCINALQSHDNEPGDSNHKMIDMMNQYGGLIHPSDALFYLTETLESIVLDVVGKFGVKIDTFQTIIEKLSELKGLPAIGCVDHHKETTRKIIDFYMIMRGHFLTESFNKNNNDSRQRTKKLRKNAKL